MKEAVIERITNAAAVGAVASPWWLPSMSGVSEVAALLLPVLGCIWLLIQIVTKLLDK